jgi:hypothetical protein
VGRASRSSGLFHLEASRARVFQSDVKTGEGAAQVVNMAPSQRLCEDQVKDGQVNVTGYVEPCYPYFAVFDVLGPRGILIFLVFCFCL